MDDLDYLFSTARIRAMEAKLLSGQKLTELVAAKPEEIKRKLEDLGWNSPDFTDYEKLDRSLSEERARIFKEVGSFSPEKKLVTVFRLKYDYHNLKAAIKARSLGKPFSGMLSKSGSIEAEKLSDMVIDENFSAMSPAMKNAAEEAIEILNRTKDPFYSDMALDRACFYEMLLMAKNSESEFLKTYIKLQIDGVNLRTAVRLKKRGLPYDHIRSAFIPDGNAELGKFLTDPTPDSLENAFAASALLPAALAAGPVLRGEAPLSSLDMACDNALMAFLKTAKYVGLGEQPVAAFLAAKEAELVAVRIIFGGKLAGIGDREIKERLRDSYV